MTHAHSKSYFHKFWNGLQFNGSNDSFSIELLPSLGATINHCNKLQKFIISPYDRLYKWVHVALCTFDVCCDLWVQENSSCWHDFLCFFSVSLRSWELFLIVLVIYSAWICPFELAFLRDLPSKLLLLENIVNSFFAIDIVLTFFVAYVDSKTHLLVDNRKRIAVRFVSGSWLFHLIAEHYLVHLLLKSPKLLYSDIDTIWFSRYLSTWFIFDVCSTAPFQPIILLFTHKGNDLAFKMLNMLRLWRLHRVSTLFARFESSPAPSYFDDEWQMARIWLSYFN